MSPAVVVAMGNVPMGTQPFWPCTVCPMLGHHAVREICTSLPNGASGSCGVRGSWLYAVPLSITCCGGTLGTNSTVSEPVRRCSELRSAVNDPALTGSVMVVGALLLHSVNCAAHRLDPQRRASMKPLLNGNVVLPPRLLVLVRQWQSRPHHASAHPGPMGTGSC